MTNQQSEGQTPRWPYVVFYLFLAAVAGVIIASFIWPDQVVRSPSYLLFP